MPEPYGGICTSKISDESRAHAESNLSSSFWISSSVTSRGVFQGVCVEHPRPIIEIPGATHATRRSTNVMPGRSANTESTDHGSSLPGITNSSTPEPRSTSVARSIHVAARARIRDSIMAAASLSISSSVASRFFASTISASISVTFSPIMCAPSRSPYFVSKISLTKPSVSPAASALRVENVTLLPSI